MDFPFPRLSGLPVPTLAGELRAFSVVRNEASRLPALLARHFADGVDRWIFLDDGSTDGTREILAAHPGVHVFAARGGYGRSRCGHDWLLAALHAFGRHGWNLVLDADEWLQLAEPLPETIAALEREGSTALEATLVDLYGQGPIAAATAGDRWWFDHPAAQRSPVEWHGPLLHGGVRRRLFRANPCLTKVPLFRGGLGLLPDQGMHGIRGARFGRARGAILHFKLLDEFPRRAAEEAARGEHWNGAAEYRCYRGMLERRPAIEAWDEETSVPWTAAAGRATGLVVAAAETPVTVLLPVRNAMPFLEEGLASLAAQTWKKFSVLAWDNGSTDGSRECLARWIPSRVPGRTVLDRPLALAGCLATMVDAAPTDLVARFDGDDVCLPERLERQVTAMLRRPDLALLGAQVDCIAADGGPATFDLDLPTESRDVLHFLLGGNPYSHPAVIFRRDAVLAVGNYRAGDGEGFHYEDYDLWLRLLARYRGANLPDVLVRYRRHTASVMGRSEAAGVTARDTARCFARNAPVFCGLEREEAERWFSGRHPAPFAVAKRIAAFLDGRFGAVAGGRHRTASFLAAVSRAVPRRRLPEKVAVVARRLGAGWRERNGPPPSVV